MLKTWLVLLVGLILAIPGVGAASQQEVLDSLIQSALDRNPELSAARNSLEAVSNAARGAGALPDPMLTVGIMNLPANSFAFDETPMSGVSVGFAQKIPWPSKLRSRTALARARISEHTAREQMVESRIVREVTEAYLDYAYWTGSRPIIEELLEYLNAAKAIAQENYANGKSSARDFLSVASKVSRAELRLLKVEQRGYAALLQLRRAVGDSSLSDALPALLSDPNDNQPGSFSIDGSPRLSRSMAAVKEAETKRRLARSDFSPDLTLGVDYRFRQTLPGDPVKGADYVSFKVGLSLPLWFFAKQNHNLRSRQQAVIASQESERSVRDQLAARHQELLSNLQFVAESLRKYDSSIIPETKASLDAAEVAYEVGEVDFKTLLSANADVFEINIERLDLLRQYHRTRAALNELVGTPHER